MSIYLLILIGVVVLQVFLSKSESKWPGLVLPIVAFLFGILIPLLMMAAPAEGATGGVILETIIICLVSSIPALVLLTIYFACRAKQGRNKQLEKMNIQDLD